MLSAKYQPFYLGLNKLSLCDVGPWVVAGLLAAGIHFGL